MPHPRAILALFVGLAIGLVFADIDQSLGRRPFTALIQHRSLLTHGFLISAILFWWAQRERHTILRLFTMGFSLATATHLAFDLFPETWRGYALLHLPFMGRTSSMNSTLWFLLSILVCLALTFALVRSKAEANLVLGSQALAFSISVVREPAFWYPLAVIVLLGGIAWVLAFTPIREQSLNQRRW